MARIFVSMVLAFALSVLGAAAQDLTKYAIPFSGGPGTVGWLSIGPCAGGQFAGWASTGGAPGCISGTSLVVTPQGGTASYPINQVLGRILSVEDFHQASDPDDTNAVNAAFNYALNNAAGNCGPVNFYRRVANNPPSTYTVSSDIIVDIGTAANNCASDGLKIIIPNGGIDLNGISITTTPTIEFRCTGQANGCNNLIITGGRFTVKSSNANGAAVVFGKPDLSDFFIGLYVNYLVPQNFSSSTTSGGLQINGMQDAIVRVQNGGGTGYAVELTELSKSVLQLSAVGSSGTALYMTNNNNQGNVIYADFSTTPGTCIKIDNAGTQQNVIYPGSFAGCTVGVNATAGNGNRLVSPMFLGGTAYAVGGTVGIIEDQGLAMLSRPSPTTGQTVAFTDPQTQPVQYMAIDAAGQLASLTVTLPTCNAASGNRVAAFGSKFPVVSLTVNAGGGSQVQQPPPSLPFGGGSAFSCVGGEGVWYPVAGLARAPAAVTVSTLPPCNAGIQDSKMVVTDASAPTYNGALTGGGAVRVPVYCNGSAWSAH